MKKLVEEFRNNKFSNLLDVYRWSGVHILEPESDAMHVFLVQSMVMQLVNTDPIIAKEIDIKDAIYRALIHDFDEAHSGDVVRTLKYANEEIRSIIVKTQSKMMRDSWIDDICDDIDKSMDDGTPEAKLIRFLDTYAAYDKMRKEYNLGNRYIATHLNNCRNYMKTFNFGVLTDPKYLHTYNLLLALRSELDDYTFNHALKVSDL